MPLAAPTRRTHFLSALPHVDRLDGLALFAAGWDVVCRDGEVVVVIHFEDGLPTPGRLAGCHAVLTGDPETILGLVAFGERMAEFMWKSSNQEI